MAPLVAIFWDYENCRPPINMSGFKIADRVKSVAQAYGQISLFKAYVDVSFEYSAPNTKAVLLHSELQCSGITLAHCPHNGKKDVVDKMMLVDMMAFAMDQPAPNTVTIVVISGDGDFSYGISTLKMRNFNMVVVASEFSANLHLLAQSSESLLWQDILVDQASNQNLNPCFGAQSDALNTSQTPNTYSQASYTAHSISRSHISSVTKKSLSPHSGSECFLRRTRYKNFTQHMRPKSVYNVFSRKALHSRHSSPPVPISGSVYHRSRRPSTSVPPLQSTVNNVPRTSRRTQKLVEPSKASSASKSSAASHIAEVPTSSHFQINVEKPCLQWKSSEKQADKSTQVFPPASTSSTSSLENKLFAESSVSENKSIKDCFVTSEELQPNDVKNEHETPSEVATTDVVACVDTANVSTASCALDQVQTGVSNVTPSTSALKPQKSNLSITHTSENQKLSSSKGGPPESPTEDRLSEIMTTASSISSEAFKPLIQILKKAQSEGKARVQWSQVGEKMKSQQTVYRLAGAENFGGYIKEAHKVGVIAIERLGRGKDQNQKWVKLNEADGLLHDPANAKILPSVVPNFRFNIASGSTKIPEPVFNALITTVN